MVILADEKDDPRLLLDSDAYLRAVFMSTQPVDGYPFCHRPIVVTDPRRPLGHIIGELRRGMESHSDAIIDKDIVLLWTDNEKRVITGADLLGRLLRGIDQHQTEARR
jgi:hypothetical protein